MKVCSSERFYAIITIVVLTVRLHVMQRTVGLLNGIIVCQHLNTIRNRDISGLFTPTGVAGIAPFHSKYLPKLTHTPSINADFDRFPLITSQP